MSSFGEKIRVQITGSAHSEYMSLFVDGINKGIKIDKEIIRNDLEKRTPKFNFNTKRIEPDEFEFVKGIDNEYTTGGQIEVRVFNSNYSKKDYQELYGFLRPGHADYVAYLQDNDYDFCGGGKFSGRLTVMLVLLGSIAKQVLNLGDTQIVSHILRVKNIVDDNLSKNPDLAIINQLNNSDFPVINEKTKVDMLNEINETASNLDSLGGIIETVIYNPIQLLGDNLFSSFESVMSHVLFAIPAVKGVEFGDGFDFVKLRGSEANDSFYLDGDQIKTSSNHNGGINGGITNGMPIVFKTVIKPTPSIGLKQTSLNVFTNKQEERVIKGRHDAFIVNRALPVINYLCYYVMLELMMRNK